MTIDFIVISYIIAVIINQDHHFKLCGKQNQDIIQILMASIML
ncbi:hypothetical protein AO369_1298 [Moraxella catarrhalis]|nr:hypothetical protein AO369_1298 [Moraxella catarrhalis]